MSVIIFSNTNCFVLLPRVDFHNSIQIWVELLEVSVKEQEVCLNPIQNTGKALQNFVQSTMRNAVDTLKA